MVHLTRRTDPMMGKRKRYEAEFKAGVALEALRGAADDGVVGQTHI